LAPERIPLWCVNKGAMVVGNRCSNFFAVTVHASIVLLFRFVQFPLAAFRRGYDLSFIPTLPLKWLGVIVSAISAGVCEETGFRGYMQRPIEEHHGAVIAILTSAVFFTLVHLNKAWSLAGMVPIVFGAGLLLGFLAWSSQSLIPGNHRSRADGHRPVRLLVDGYCRRIQCTAFS